LSDLQSLKSIPSGTTLSTGFVHPADVPQRDGGAADTHRPVVASTSIPDQPAQAFPVTDQQVDLETAHPEALSLLPRTPRPPLSSPSDKQQAPNEGQGAPAGASTATGSVPNGDSEDLSVEDQGEVEKLKDRDREVRAHEQAHVAAAGPYARGGPKYEYERGPDGRRYAVGGEVGIDTSRVAGDPEATIQKARVVKRAALAPAEPSGQDRQVAAEASRLEAEAHREMAKQSREEGAQSGLTAVAVGAGTTWRSRNREGARPGPEAGQRLTGVRCGSCLGSIRGQDLGGVREPIWISWPSRACCAGDAAATQRAASGMRWV
jgi:hypothetical protein